MLTLAVFAVLAFSVRHILLDSYGVVFTDLQFGLLCAATFLCRLYRRRDSDPH